MRKTVQKRSVSKINITNGESLQSHFTDRNAKGIDFTQLLRMETAFTERTYTEFDLKDEKPTETSFSYEKDT